MAQSILSVRVDDKNRIVCKLNENVIEILQRKDHYNDH